MITAFKFEFGVASIEKDIVSGFPEQEERSPVTTASLNLMSDEAQ